MKAWLMQLILPWVVFALPWSAFAYQRRWALAAALGILWLSALACAAWLWFGPGVLALVALGGATVAAASFDAAD